MSDTHQWNVSISGEVIATIDAGEWRTGPFAPGEFVVLANIVVKNTGSQTGSIYGQSFFYPGQSNEIKNTKTTKTNIQPGQTWEYNPVASIPAGASGIVPVGVKVWGETENEPSWSLLGIVNVEEGAYILPVVAIFGLLGLGAWVISK